MRRIDLFDDIMEGKSHQEILRHNIETLNIENPANDTEEMLMNVSKSLKQNKIIDIDKRYACCFFLGSHESMAMWKIYSKPGSVALKYEPRYFADSLETKIDEQQDIGRFKKIIFGKVKYTDFLTPVKVKDRAFRKNKSYQHEQEVRLMIELKQKDSERKGIQYKTHFPFLGGLEIIAHPATSKWQLHNLNDLTSKYQPNYKVSESMLKDTLRYGADF
ncbi:hypothetical protein [Fulvivirga sp.]|uniref:hypothetical protein n=1 Tax=Fulvivirga sp. TaxID=1931237 RepID=UPI0032EABE41